MKKSNAYFINLFMTACFFVACSPDNKEVDPLESDKTPPSVDLTFAGIPSNSQGTAIVVSQEFEINISAQDANGISKVEAYLDGDKVGEDTTPPFSIRVDVSQLESKSLTGKYKDYLLEVVATDRAGNTTSVTQTINVDNLLPVITEVSLLAQTVLSGSDNPVSFQVTDNEGLSSVSLFLNDELVSELAIEGPFATTIDTSVLPEGPNTLRIEAKDLAENVSNFVVEFISDNQGPEIVLENVSEGQIIDQVLTLNPTVTDLYSEVASVTLTYNSESLIVVESGAAVSFDFDPAQYAVGSGTLEVIATDAMGNSSNLALSTIIHRRLIEINIPENWLSPYVTAAVIFLSRMDGTVITWEEITPEDRQFIGSVPEELNEDNEFMLSFYWEDNGGIATLSTHQHLTPQSPGTLTLTVPSRRDGTGLNIEVPTVNFLSNDILIGESATSYSFLQSVDNAPASYTAYLDTAQDFLGLSPAIDPFLADPFDQVYIFDLRTFSNILIPYPVPNDYVFDKGNMTTNNLESRQLQVSSAAPLDNTISIFRIAGALSMADDNANKFHEMFVWNQVGSLDSPMIYQINTNFTSYRHALQFGKWYTERKGEPLATYTIPDLSVDYTIANNAVDLTIQGNEHALGRMQFFDTENETFVWNLTFDSKAPGPVTIPELPVSISHPVATSHQNGTITIEKVELVSYETIPSYREYIDQVIKNQVNILNVTDGYQIVYKSRTGSFTVPLRDFLFQ